MRTTASVVVTDFNVLRSRSSPAKADAPLIVHADTVLTLAVTLKRLKAIAGRDRRSSSVAAASSCVSFRVATPEAWRFPGFKELASIVALEALDHRSII
jgi:hypothetical protein